MDTTVYPGSRIDRLPSVVRPAALLARAGYSLTVRLLRGTGLRLAMPFESDGIATKHNHGFDETPAFRKAYARAVKAAGWDYGIPWRVHQMLWCAREARKVSGDFVELGTGRGFMMSAALADYAGWEDDRRQLHLFDTFASAWPGKDGNQDSAAPKSKYYAESVDPVRANFAEWSRVEFHQGDVFETIPRADIGQIALLHIDHNPHPPEDFGQRTFWPRVARGGVLLLDDYASRGFEPQYSAMNKAAADLGINILTMPSGQGIAIK